MPLIFSAFPMSNEKMKNIVLNDFFIEKIGGEWGNAPSGPGKLIPVLRTTNFRNDGNIDYSDVVYRDIPAEKLKSKFLQTSDIIIEKSGGSEKQPVGRVVFFQEQSDKFVCNNFTQILRVNTDAYLPRYVFYYLYFLWLCGATVSFQNKTTGIHNLQLSAYLNMTVRMEIPPLSQQKQIAMRLDKIQELVSLQKEQIRKLEQLVKSRFIEMFGDPVSNHKEWEIKTLKDLGAVMSGGTPARSISKYFGGNINWFSAGELNSLFIDKSLETITEEGLLHSNAKLFPAGSLLIGMYDTAAFKLSILKQKAAFNQACAAISPEVVKVIWLYYVLSLLKHEALKFRRGVRQKNLNLQFIRDFKVPVPPLDLQKQFTEFVEKTETQKALLEKRLNRLETLYKSLMQQYFG